MARGKTNTRRTKQSYEMFIERAIKAFNKGQYVFIRVI